MRRLILCLMLAGCATSGPDEDARMTSMVAFDPVSFAGRWHVVEGVAGTDCASYDFSAQGAVSAACAGGLQQGTARLSGPGRMTVVLGGRREEYRVMWVDADYRTAVIGTPSRRLGVILNRQPSIPADRLRAAREVMDWNGYDVAALRDAQ